MIMSNEYIAGFIDGEGCIYIHRQISTGQNHKHTHTVCVRIVNEHGGVLEQIQDRFGGTIRRQKPSSAGKRHYDLCITGYKALELLIAVRPYLVIKQNQADAVIFNWEHLRPMRGGNPRKPNITDESYHVRENVWQTLKTFKTQYDVG